MTSRRRYALLTIAVATLFALTGCDKPTPIVRMVSGGEYADSQAMIWCFGDDTYSGPGSCTERKVVAPRLKTRAGDQVSVEVPESVADRFWYVSVATIAETPPSEAVDEDSMAAPTPEFQRGPLQKDSYFSFTVPEFGESSVLPVQVVALGGSDTNSGMWQFLLVNADTA